MEVLHSFGLSLYDRLPKTATSLSEPEVPPGTRTWEPLPSASLFQAPGQAVSQFAASLQQQVEKIPASLPPQVVESAVHLRDQINTYAAQGREGMHSLSERLSSMFGTHLAQAKAKLGSTGSSGGAETTTTTTSSSSQTYTKL